MTLNVDLDNVAVTEFGVGRDHGNGPTFVSIPTDAGVQAAVRGMVQATWDALQRREDGPARYEPAEKYGSTEYLYLPLEDAMAASVRELHEAVNLDISGSALDNFSEVFCYFARLTDKKKQRLTALRRATQFKGVLKKRLIRFVSDSLKLIDDRVFKLDNEFDLLVDATKVYILRPSRFEFAGKLQEAILDAVPRNIAAVQEDLKFVDFDGIEEYAGKHMRAARYLASIRALDETKRINRALLKRLCKQTGVDVKVTKGKLKVAAGHELGFLEVLDRRRYEVSLVKEAPERYRAASRRKING